MVKVNVLIIVMLSLIVGMSAMASSHAIIAGSFITATLLLGITVLCLVIAIIKLEKLFLMLEMEYVSA